MLDKYGVNYVLRFIYWVYFNIKRHPESYNLGEIFIDPQISDCTSFYHSHKIRTNIDGGYFLDLQNIWTFFHLPELLITRRTTLRK